MKWLNYLLFFCVITVNSQDSISVIKQRQSPLDVSQIIGIDNFGTEYFLKNNIFYKKTTDNTINYSNVQLGNLTTVNTFNPLKLVLFYKDFNTVIILDNRLAEVYKIDFNSTQPYKNITHVSIGNDNTIWTFNQDLQQLQLYDYKAKLVRATTLPVVSNVLDLTSNYNYCWLLTENYLYKYSYFGSLLFKIENKGFSKLSESNDNIILNQGNALFYLDDKTQKITPVKTPELLINQFLVTAETLYIYDSKILHEFQLKN
ncbi:hypothetical protein C1T31_06300 [Hanstruepera neustonica]|uniref:Uncharacterized protein n=1 Tax=Hanstruepera neustonica TaxID=1445657 RepID=A0A2K1E0W6_9FLAO|nr:hypothetical protein [Hanstruepera neustonica]PNQ73932.1 hypothetical protein C1T31_06300 [Hanstruepera neustonica]